MFARFALCLLALSATATAQTVAWGSFDVTRINYATGTFTGADHSMLRNLVTANGGTIAPATPTLTPAYLAGIDVFYTSLLNQTTGALAAPEQVALQSWIAGGGTLVVTADIFPLAAYDSFTAFYGVTNYTPISGAATGSVVATHPLTQGVSQFQYVTNSTFTFGADAKLLGNDVLGNAFLVVLEPATGFTAGGRIVLFGDHNMFTNFSIGKPDNSLLAGNLAQWAALAGGPCPSHLASGTNYGSGWPGTLGVPALTALTPPVVGGIVTLQLGNSFGQPTTAWMLLGAAPASVPTNLGGTLLVNAIPGFGVTLPLPPAGLILPGALPAMQSLCGTSIYLQFVEADPGASHGASFTPGLQLTLGS